MMAIVENRAFTDAASSQLDNKLSTPSRNNAGTPIGVLTPTFAGELITDTTNSIIFVATGLGVNDWAPTSLSVD